MLFLGIFCNFHWISESVFLLVVSLDGGVIVGLLAVSGFSGEASGRFWGFLICFSGSSQSIF